MTKRLLGCICIGTLLLALPAGASPKLYKVTYVVTGTGLKTADVSFEGPSGAVAKTVRLPFKVTFKFPRGASISISAYDISMSPKSRLSCAVEQPGLPTARNSAPGPLPFVTCN